MRSSKSQPDDMIMFCVFSTSSAEVVQHATFYINVNHFQTISNVEAIRFLMMIGTKYKLYFDTLYFDTKFHIK
jgi:hypothetical protein